MLSSLDKRLYNSWYGLGARAAGKGKGHTRYVWPEWLADYRLFADMVGQPPSQQHVLCLREPDLGYVPGNVYWGTWRDRQQYVTHSRRIEYQGKSLSLSGWARKTGLLAETIRKRLDAGLPLSRVLSGQRWPNRCVPRTVKSHRTSSRFIGVSYRPRDASWEAKIRVRRVLYYLGVYHSERDAAEAVRLARELIGQAATRSPNDLAELLRREVLSRPRVKRPERKSKCRIVPGQCTA